MTSLFLWVSVPTKTSKGTLQLHQRPSLKKGAVKAGAALLWRLSLWFLPYTQTSLLRINTTGIVRPLRVERVAVRAG